MSKPKTTGANDRLGLVPAGGGVVQQFAQVCGGGLLWRRQAGSAGAAMGRIPPSVTISCQSDALGRSA